MSEFARLGAPISSRECWQYRLLTGLWLDFSSGSVGMSVAHSNRLHLGSNHRRSKHVLPKMTRSATSRFVQQTDTPVQPVWHGSRPCDSSRIVGRFSYLVASMEDGEIDKQGLHQRTLTSAFSAEACPAANARKFGWVDHVLRPGSRDRPPARSGKDSNILTFKTDRSCPKST